MSEAETPHPCKCGNAPVYDSALLPESDTDVGTHLICLRCGACGPLMPTAEEAVRAWNAEQTK